MLIESYIAMALLAAVILMICYHRWERKIEHDRNIRRIIRYTR